MSEGKAGGPKVGLDRSKVGRKKGTPNKTTKLLKDAILKAAEKAGGKGGLVSFLQAQAARKDNAPFMALLGKVLPLQIGGDPDGAPLTMIQRIERVIVPAKGDGE
jgi:hypothetical protein